MLGGLLMRITFVKDLGQLKQATLNTHHIKYHQYGTQ